MFGSLTVAGVLQILELIATNAPAAIDTGEKLIATAEQVWEGINGTPMTDAQRADLRAQITASAAIATKPLPEDWGPDYADAPAS